MQPITVYIPFSTGNHFPETLRQFTDSPLVNKVIVAGAGSCVPGSAKSLPLSCGALCSGESITRALEYADTEFLLFVTQAQGVDLKSPALQRLCSVARDSCAGMVYSDFYDLRGGCRSEHRTIEYQTGSIRDNFDFGALMLFSCAALRSALEKSGPLGAYAYAGLYDLRLKLSVDHLILHLPEFLYTKGEVDTRASGEKQFDYVDPRNREVQIEYEQAATSHLKDIGACLAPDRYSDPPASNEQFETEATVVIPVRNRESTIAEALASVLSQKCNFAYNCIVVDNHSTDATAQIVQAAAVPDNRVHLLRPVREDLAIGGCWNEALLSRHCGRYAVQLDSDDLYSTPETLQKIVDLFHSQNCAMVIGSYTLVNDRLEVIAPGLIDHSEWTADNGRNNALRINGLGAPRAFDTAILRTMLLPDTSYGEDYATALRISREYRIGRIYSPLYLCRRWEGNTDAALPLEKINTNDFYKDKIRTIEILARMRMNAAE